MESVGSFGRLLLFTVLVGFSSCPVAQALTSQVLLTGGLDEELRERVQANLTSAVNAIDRGDIDAVREFCTENGWRELNEITSCLRLHNARPVHETRLLDLPCGYEVRDIRMQVDRESMQNTRVNPYQYMVFTLNPEGLVHGVRFAIEESRIDDVLSGADSLEDFAFRQQILQFVEIYRTAYNRKDLEYIETVFSEDALIIVGRKVKTDPNAPKQSDQFRRSTFRDNIQFFRKTKEEYINSLRRVFDRNDFLHVGFDSISVVHHGSDPYLYGVTLKQEWRSSTYGDTGYVFLMIDFKNEDNPLIHVRSWQPEKFADGTTIDIYDFQLIRND